MADDDEFETIDHTVRQQIDLIERTEYFAPGTARYFLEELAVTYARRGFQPMAVSAVVASPRWTWPDGISSADKQVHGVKLLTDSGVGTVSADRFRFTSAAVCNFLKASHVARRSFGFWQRLWRLPANLRPRAERDEVNEQFMRFLVIMLWPVVQSSVVRRLNKFLVRRHRYPNILVVADLCRRRPLPGSDLRERTTAILSAETESAERPEHEWAAMVEALGLLDAPTAITALDNAASAPGMDSESQFLAVVELTKRDAARGAESLEYLAKHLSGPSAMRFAVAERIAEINPDVGRSAYETVVADWSNGPWSVKSALRIDSPPLWREGLTSMALMDDERLPLLDALLQRNPDQTSELVALFVPTTRRDHTRLGLAERFRGHDPGLAWEVADEVAWTEKRDVDEPARLGAVRLLAEFEPSQAQSLFERLAETSTRSGETRFKAAHVVLVEFNSPGALVKLAHEEGLDLPAREKSAEALAKDHPELSATAYIAVAQDCGGKDLIRLVKAAYGLSPRPAEEAIVRIAKDRTYPDKTRIDAVSIATAMSRTRRNELYSIIARTAKSDDTALSLADKILNSNRRAGQLLMAELAATRPMPFKQRLYAAERAAEHGTTVLTKMAARGRPPEERLDAALVLRKYRTAAGNEIIEELAMATTTGKVCVVAAQHLLPKQKVLPSLANIVKNDAQPDPVRKAACDAVVKHGRGAGRQLLVDIARTEQLPQRVHNHITRLTRR